MSKLSKEWEKDRAAAAKPLKPFLRWEPIEYSPMGEEMTGQMAPVFDGDWVRVEVVEELLQMLRIARRWGISSKGFDACIGQDLADNFDNLIGTE